MKKKIGKRKVRKVGTGWVYYLQGRRKVWVKL